MNDHYDIEKIKIEAPDKRIHKKIKENWDNIAKPIDGLGTFEEIICKIGSIIGDEKLIGIDNTLLLILCADNGVTDEKVTQTSYEVTASVAAKMGKKESSVCRMAACVGTDVEVYDMGIKVRGEIKGVNSGYKIAMGTDNCAIKPAMSTEEAKRCIEAGIDMVKRAKDKGRKIIAVGEMGIGNTTTSAAVTAGLLKLRAKSVTGRGAGLSDEGYARKIKVVDLLIDKYGLFDLSPLEILSDAGGFDIAGLTGICIGGAIYHIPIVLDGFITECAALVADSLVPGVKDYLIASHSGAETAVKLIEDRLKLKPVIYGELKLGEGTGAMMLIGLIKQVLSVYNGVYSFSDIDLDNYERYE